MASTWRACRPRTRTSGTEKTQPPQPPHHPPPTTAHRPPPTRYVTFYTIPPWAYQPPKGANGKGAGKRQCTSVAKSTINPVWDDVVDLEIKVSLVKYKSHFFLNLKYIKFIFLTLVVKLSKYMREIQVNLL